MKAVRNLFVPQVLRTQAQQPHVHEPLASHLGFFRIRRLAFTQDFLQNSLCNRLLEPDSSIGHFANRDGNLVNGPVTLKDAFCSSAKCTFKEVNIFAVGK